MVVKQKLAEIGRALTEPNHPWKGRLGRPLPGAFGALRGQLVLLVCYLALAPCKANAIEVEIGMKQMPFDFGHTNIEWVD